MSYNGGSAVAPRIRNVTTSGFQVVLQEEEELRSGGHAVETLGWIAMDRGAGAAGGVAFEALVTPDTVRHEDHTVSFTQSFGAPPVLVAAMNTFDGSDTATLRYRTLTAGSATLFIEEEQSADDEVAHTTERVGCLVFDAGAVEASSSVKAARLAGLAAAVQDAASDHAGCTPGAGGGGGGGGGAAAADVVLGMCVAFACLRRVPRRA
jgi:hypothetical protein